MSKKILYLQSQSFETKAMDDNEDESVVIEGYANTKSLDRYRDIVNPEAFRKGIGDYLKNPIILAFHNHSEPVGKMLDYRVDDVGLWIKAKISKAADKVYGLIKDGIISAFSVSFIVEDAEYDSDSDVFMIKALELLEISVVSVGANRDSLFNLAKSFNNNKEFIDYKLEFDTNRGKSTKQEDSLEVNNSNNKKGIFDMDEEKIQQLLAEAAAKAATDAIQAAEARKAAEEAEKAKKLAEEKALEDKVKSIVSGETGGEKLLKAFEEKLNDQNKSITEALAEIKAELEEKKAELAALQRSKMTFDDGNREDVTYAQKEAAVLMAKMLRKSVSDTIFGKQLLEKAGPHVASATWELEVSLRMESEVRRRLVIASLFTPIDMQTNVMTIPINPDTGVATWIQNSEFGTDASSGTAQVHQLGEITLNAYKVATKEYVNFEEEEDSLLPLIPVIREAMIHRLAKAIDRAFLRGVGAGGDPVKGLVEYDAASTVTVSAGSGTVSIANMQALRKDLGSWGLDPAMLRYVVSTEVYYELLADTNFQTVDKVGDRATLLTGQIGAIGNTPVLVSAEFEAKANTKAGALVVAPSNFLVGNQRGLRVDMDDLVEKQRKVFVASMRTGMVQKTLNEGPGVSVLRYTS